MRLALSHSATPVRRYYPEWPRGAKSVVEQRQPMTPTAPQGKWRAADYRAETPQSKLPAPSEID